MSIRLTLLTYSILPQNFKERVFQLRHATHFIILLELLILVKLSRDPFNNRLSWIETINETRLYNCQPKHKIDPVRPIFTSILDFIYIL